jgi:hypothetical protein
MARRNATLRLDNELAACQLKGAMSSGLDPCKQHTPSHMTLFGSQLELEGVQVDEGTTLHALLSQQLDETLIFHRNLHPFLSRSIKIHQRPCQRQTAPGFCPLAVLVVVQSLRILVLPEGLGQLRQHQGLNIAS